MKRFILFFLFCLLSFGAATLKLAETKQLREYDTVPKELPTVAEDVFDTDVYVSFIRLSNTTASSRTVTIADKQGTPISILPAVAIAANTVYTIHLDRQWCPSGVTWVASGAGVTGYMRGLK